MDAEAQKLLQERLGHQFRDVAMLDLALRHASVAEARVHSNERLEFLGDAVLGLIVCQRVYEKFPDLLEGEMTKIKSTVVSRHSCAQMGRDLGLAEFLEIGKGMRTHSVLPISLAAAALESVIAAIYLDSGFEAARAFLLPRVEPFIDRAVASGHQENFKSILQQHSQQSLAQTPAYVVVSHRGPDHAKHFEICVQIGERRFEPAWGASKKQAEQSAALNALHDLGVVRSDEDGVARLVRPAPNADSDANGSATADATTPAAADGPAASAV